MISRLEISLKSEAQLSYQMGTAFHGALMELIPEDLCEMLHESAVHPYSQYIEHRKDGKWYWVITALNKELAKEIIYGSLLACEGTELKKSGIKLEFAEKNLHEISMKKLSERMYAGAAPGYINIEFITPASFKQEGRYLFYPDIRGMYISLLNKYGAAVPDQNVRDEDLLEELVRCTRISRYNLRSVLFHIERRQGAGVYRKYFLKIFRHEDNEVFCGFPVSFRRILRDRDKDRPRNGRDENY